MSESHRARNVAATALLVGAVIFTGHKWGYINFDPRVSAQGDGQSSSSASPSSSRSPSPKPSESPGKSKDVLVQIPENPLPVAETEPFQNDTGDDWDDMALAPNAEDPDKSSIIAADKGKHGGVAVLDTTGKILQFQELGSIGNIDGRQVDGKWLFGANDRKHQSLEFWWLDADKQELSERATSRTVKTDTGKPENYGSCLYQPSDDELYAFVTPHEKGFAQQFKITIGKDDKIDAKEVRRLPMPDTTEACVADDKQKVVYFGVETHGTQVFDADPDGSTKGRYINEVGDGHTDAELEGMDILRQSDDSALLVASNQFKNRYTITDVSDPKKPKYIRTFKVGASGTIDKTSRTDGLAITSDNMGQGFEHGMFIVHDHDNQRSDDEDEGGTQSNAKIIALEEKE